MDTVVDGDKETYVLLLWCIVINKQCIQLFGSHRFMCFDRMASPLPLLVLAVGGSFLFFTYLEARNMCKKGLVGAVTPNHIYTTDLFLS